MEKSDQHTTILKGIGKKMVSLIYFMNEQKMEENQWI